jgi:hypothetical protein
VDLQRQSTEFNPLSCPSFPKVATIREAASGYYTESLTIVGDVCGENHIVAITKLYNMLTTAPHYFFCDCPTPEPGCQAAYVVVIGLRFFVLVLAELLTPF